MLSMSRNEEPRYSQRAEEGYQSEEEALVDMIAAEILMPTDEIVALLSGRSANWQLVRDLADHFKVSLTAVARRLLNLHGISGMWVRSTGDSSERCVVWGSPSIVECIGEKDCIWVQASSLVDRTGRLRVLHCGLGRIIEIPCRTELFDIRKKGFGDRQWTIGWISDAEADYLYPSRV